MDLSISHLQPLVALGAGLLILIMPRLLNYIVAIYLIVVGLVGLGLIKGCAVYPRPAAVRAS